MIHITDDRKTSRGPSLPDFERPRASGCPGCFATSAWHTLRKTSVATPTPLAGRVSRLSDVFAIDQLERVDKGLVVMMFTNHRQLFEWLPKAINGPTGPEYHYEWGVTFALPFPMPAKQCPGYDIELNGDKYRCEIHNCMDYFLFYSTKGIEPFARIGFVNKNEPDPVLPEPLVGERHKQSAVSIYWLDRKFDTPMEAFQGSRQRNAACLDHLNQTLGKWQQYAPFSCAGLVYPLRELDIPESHFTVYLATAGGKSPFSSIRRTLAELGLSRPMFTMVPPEEQPAVSSIIQVPYELMGEALVALQRGATRLSLLSSYSAVELFANNVFKELADKSSGRGDVSRSEQILKERLANRTNMKFLAHFGIKKFTTSSLHDTDKQLYDDLLALQEVRHQLAHAGEKPSEKESQAAFHNCCKALQWFGGVAGIAVKPFAAAIEDSHLPFDIKI